MAKKEIAAEASESIYMRERVNKMRNGSIQAISSFATIFLTICNNHPSFIEIFRCFTMMFSKQSAANFVVCGKELTKQ